MHASLWYKKIIKQNSTIRTHKINRVYERSNKLLPGGLIAHYTVQVPVPVNYIQTSAQVTDLINTNLAFNSFKGIRIPITEFWGK